MVHAILISIFVLCSSPVWGAIAFVSNTEAPNTLAGTITKSVVVSAGSNRILVLASYARRTSGVTPASITGCTFNTSETFTNVRRDTVNINTSAKTELWYLVNPTVTTSNVVCTYADAGTDRVQAFNMLLFTGVDQVSPIDAQNGSSANVTNSFSTTIVTSAANAWIVDSMFNQWNVADMTVGGNQTIRSQRLLGSATEDSGSSTVNGKASPGSEVISWNRTGTYDYVQSVLSLKPFVAGSPLRQLSLTGVGQ